MDKIKEIIKIPIMKVFSEPVFYLNLHDRDIILNSIYVCEVDEDNGTGKPVLFNIQKISEDEIRVIPNSSHKKFFIRYDCMVKAITFTIKAKDVPKYKNTDGSISISFDKTGTIINQE